MDTLKKQAIPKQYVINADTLPNHYAKDCIQRQPSQRNQQIPYPIVPQNEWSHASVKRQQQKQHRRENQIIACISLEVDFLSYVPLKFFNSEHLKALIDTGAWANAISEKDYEKLKYFCENISHLAPSILV